MKLTKVRNWHWNFDPCCSTLSLGQASRIIAYVNITLSFVEVMAYIFVLIFVMASPPSLIKENSLENMLFFNGHHLKFSKHHHTKNSNSDFSPYQTVVLWTVIHIIVSSSLMYLGIYLLRVVTLKNPQGMDIWYKISCCLLLTKILLFIVQLTLNVSENGDFNWLFPFIGLCYLVYTLFVIREYRREIILENMLVNVLSPSEKTPIRKYGIFAGLPV